ncbi:MAG: sulfate adenylyltransferase subunit CysN, partial [Bacteroidaceae bacterium]|nr:sulfate adenylyltransferase subunit CysN [Bacteroidaceae bacterium]
MANEITSLPQDGSKAGVDIKAYLDADEKKSLLRLLTAGSVDDGKSTLIGRLLFDSKKLYEDQLTALERDSKRVGNAGAGQIDYALLLDGLKAEREEGITIDVAYRYFSTNQRKFIIADTPGHEQYTRNMITGGSTANLAIILVDARTGVITQTRRHTFLVSLLGIKHIVLAVNKMDLVAFSEDVFNKIRDEYLTLTTQLGIEDVTCFPLSALEGDNVVERSERTPWYKGPSLLEVLETVPIHRDRNMTDFRYTVQYVLRPNLDFRGFSGKIASGIVRKGDEVVALPSMKRSHVKSIVTYDGELEEAFCPQCVTLTLEDEIDISRGEMIVHPDNMPHIGRHFTTMLVWMDEEPMDTAKQFFLKHNTNTTRATIAAIRHRVDVNTLEKKEGKPFHLNEIGQVDILTAKTLFFDSYATNRQTGAFILIDPITNNTSAVGMIIEPLDES